MEINGASLWDAWHKQKWKVDYLMLVDDTALVADSEDGLQESRKVLDYVCKKRKLKVNVNNSKVMIICGNSEENAVNVILE